MNLERGKGGNVTSPALRARSAGSWCPRTPGDGRPPTAPTVDGPLGAG